MTTSVGRGGGLGGDESREPARLAEVISLFGDRDSHAASVTAGSDSEPAPVASSRPSRRADRAPSSRASRSSGGPEEFSSIEQASLRRLSRRSWASRELARTLERDGYEAHEVADEIARLEGAGLLDDEVLARDLAESMARRKGSGRAAIQAALAARFVAPSAIEGAIADLDRDAEGERAIEFAIQRIGRMDGLDPAVRRRRLTASLLRRGFEFEQAFAAVREAEQHARQLDQPSPGPFFA